jgi:hypothetical protein
MQMLQDLFLRTCFPGRNSHRGAVHRYLQLMLTSYYLSLSLSSSKMAFYIV